MQWSVRARVPVLEALGALVLLALALTGGDPVGRVLGVAGAVLLGVLAGRDVLVRTRLSADADGVTVIAGFAGRRTLSWPQLASVRLEERSRLGLRSRLLELDSGDQLVLLSARDLGTDPEQVASALAELRP